MGRIRVGVSGWSYPHWRGVFYPDDMKPRDQLAYLAQRFDTVEVNATFYRLGKPAIFRHWYRSVPEGFVFAVKGGRYITHTKKLVDAGTPLANFLASGVLELGEKLGPILWQLPESLRFHRDRIQTFLALLPRDTAAARQRARTHDERIRDPAFGPDDCRQLRHVVEVRHQSFLCDEAVDLARSHGVALAFSHSSAWPYVEDVTAGFVYLRMHGPGRLYASAYGSDLLAAWSERLLEWSTGGQPRDARTVGVGDSRPAAPRDAYAYFNNDGGAHAPCDADRLRDLLSR